MSVSQYLKWKYEEYVCKCCREWNIKMLLIRGRRWPRKWAAEESWNIGNHTLDRERETLRETLTRKRDAENEKDEVFIQVYRRWWSSMSQFEVIQIIHTLNIYIIWIYMTDADSCGWQKRWSLWEEKSESERKIFDIYFLFWTLLFICCWSFGSLIYVRICICIASI